MKLFSMNYFLKYCTSFSIFFLCISTFAQDVGGIRGYVLDRQSQRPLEYAQISVEGAEIENLVKDLDISVNANSDGYFQMTGLPFGDAIITVKMPGYETRSRKVSIKSSRIGFERFLLNESVVTLDDVIIDVKRQEQQTKVATGVVQLSAKSITTFSIGGEPDLMRALQVLPGVITTGDQGGQLYIRGGAPIQNLVKLDGMILYNPFHSIGFFSVFDTDILQRADVYTAGFGAKYGGRNSSVMDIRTRSGNRKKYSGKVSSSTYMSKVLLEAPIGKRGVDGLAPSSLLISAKASYLDAIAPIVYPYVATEYGGLPFSFQDIFGKYSIESKGGNRVNLFGFNFNDAVRFAGDKTISWQSNGYGADFLVIPASSGTLIEAHLAQSNYKIQSTELLNRPRQSAIDGFNGGLDFTYLLRKYDEFKYGLEFVGYRTDYEYTNSVGRTLDQVQNTTEIGGYMEYKRQQGRWLVQPGLRLHNYGSLAIVRVEPRIGLKFNATEYLRFKGSAGRYSQNLVAANSDRDVVNLFYGFLSGAGDLPNEFDGTPVVNSLQTANHYVLGTELNLSKGFKIELEGYIKQFDQITNINRYKIYDDIPVYEDQDELLRKDFMIERGLARGIDALLTYQDKHWYFWGVYSLGKVSRFDGVQNYAPQFDRRHNLNLLLAYKGDKDWEINFRWNFGSGFPFTPIRGYFENQTFTDPQGQPLIDYPYRNANGSLGVLYGDINSQRLPSYHRLDFTAKKGWDMKTNQRLEVAFAATNTYNRRNIFYYDTPSAKRVNQLPIMPTLMLSYAF